MSRLRIRSIAMVVALGFLLSPLYGARATAPPSSADPAAAIFAVERSSCREPLPVDLAAKKPYGFPNKADCYAQCGGGTTVSCLGAQSCSAANRNCSTGERGHCTDSNGTKYCPEPCPCSSTAYCWDGSTRTCSGNSSCSATDSSCSSQRGFCTSDAETKYCPPCPEDPPPSCNAMAYCLSGPPIFCSGSSCDEKQGCWVVCDGSYMFCPGQDMSCIVH